MVWSGPSVYHESTSMCKIAVPRPVAEVINVLKNFL
jgi:hypothetical protein